MLFQTLHEIDTRNGRMRLVKLFGSERLLAEDRTEQSGSYMNSVWKTAFKALPKKYAPQTITFFGVGMGGALKLATKQFPNAKIIGIEWDPTLCTIAREKLAENTKITLVEADAEKWVENMLPSDISCVDLFTGSDVAPCVRNIDFLKNIISNSRITLINIYTHTEILDNVDKVVAPLPYKRLQYYASTIGMYGSPHLRS
jgi:spermidine synthase